MEQRSSKSLVNAWMADQGMQNSGSFTLPINVDANVTPDAPVHAQPTIGLIGMGAMGYMYAKLLSQAGWKKSVYFRCVNQHWPHSDLPVST